MTEKETQPNAVFKEVSFGDVFGRARSFLSRRWWVFAIYAIAFATPLLSRVTKKAATELGCMPLVSTALSYAAVLVVGVLGVWLLATRWRRVEAITPLNKPYGLPAMSVDPLVAVLAAIAILLVPLFLGGFGQEGAVFASSESLAYRVVYRVGSIALIPLIEEVGHRWLLYRGLRPARANCETLGRRFICVAPAVVISGMFFGLAHYLVASPSRIAVTMVVGMILALSYEVTGKLWVPILAHILINMHANLTAEFGINGRYGVITSTIAIAVFCWVSLVRNSADLRVPWNAHR